MSTDIDNITATIRRWAKEDRRKGKGGISDYSCKEGESL